MIQKSNFRTIYCVIDALDECQHDSLSQLLIKLEQLSDSDDTPPKKLKLIGLSQRYPVTIPESLDLFTKIKLDMMSASKEDVERFIAERVYTLVRKKFNDKIKARIQEDFQRKSEGTFLWVSFMAQDLEQKSLREIEPALRALPAGLDAVYDRILSQISLSERDTINTLLSWILVATRPLRILELCAVADVGATELLSRDEVCRELIKSCGHLLQISEGVSSMIFFEEQVGTDEEMRWVGAFDEEERFTGEDFWSLSVTFLHQSAKDYIVKHKDASLGEEDGTSVRRLHGFVANHLIRYFRKISRHADFVDNQFYKMMVDLPLALYTTRTWILHLEVARVIKQVVLQNKRFFGEGSASRDAYEDIMESIEWEFQEQLGPAGPTDFEVFTGSESPAESESCAIPLLHLACYRNLQRLVRWCLTDGQLEYTNVPWGIESRTPLHFAIIQQNEEIVNMLLDANADILAEVSTRQNAFVCAMYHQDIEILRRMAEQNDCKRWMTQEALNPKTTLLWEACFARNKEACRLLIEKFSFDVNAKVPQRDRAVIYDLFEWNNVELALTFFVMWNAHVNSWKALEVIIYHDQNRFRMWQQLLLIDINAKHEKGYNACVMALQAPSSRVSKLSTFLRWGCDSNQPDNEGRTPFHHCAMERSLLRSPQEFEGALALLLSKGAHVNGVCHRGRTILHYLTNSFSQPHRQSGPLQSSDARQLVVYLLDRGVDRHAEDNEGLSALQALGTCLFPSRDQIGYDEWLESVKAAKEMIFVLQEYSTVPDPPWYDASLW